MPSMLALYHGMPYPVRVWMASAQGYLLRRQRYAGAFPRALESVQERETWSAPQWKRWQEDSLARLLHRAATRVPWYRAHWEARRRQGDPSSWEILSNWPILQKEELQKHGRALIADDRDPRNLLYTVTSGTTGTPKELWMSAAMEQAWYAQVEVRLRHWHGVSRHDSWAHIGGRQVASVHAQRPPFWVWNAGLNQLYLSPYHMKPGWFSHYGDALKKHGVRYILGYASALHELARGFLAEGVTGIQLQTAVTDGEPVLQHYRETVRRAFGCELRESYGMVERAAAASECPHGTLHSWPDTGILEAVDGQQAVVDGDVGDFLCTSLLNTDMPLIRYRNGDRGSISREPSSCACGRILPEILSIEGRISDIIVTPDGRRLSPSYVENIYEEKHPIAEAQLVQHAVDRVTLRFVPLPGFNAKSEEGLRRAVLRILGPMEIRLEPMAQIPRGANGKTRAVVSQLTDEERRVSSAP